MKTAILLGIWMAMVAYLALSTAQNIFDWKRSRNEVHRREEEDDDK